MSQRNLQTIRNLLGELIQLLLNSYSDVPGFTRLISFFSPFYSRKEGSSCFDKPSEWNASPLCGGTHVNILLKKKKKNCLTLFKSKDP